MVTSDGTPAGCACLYDSLEINLVTGSILTSTNSPSLFKIVSVSGALEATVRSA